MCRRVLVNRMINGDSYCYGLFRKSVTWNVWGRKIFLEDFFPISGERFVFTNRRAREREREE